MSKGAKPKSSMDSRNFKTKIAKIESLRKTIMSN